MIDKQAILRNIRQPDERLLLAKVLDQADFSLKHHSNAFTDFISPSQMSLVLEVVGHMKDINHCVFGGNDECERRIIGFCPDYYEIEKSDFPIKALKIKINTKFSNGLTHRDFLGAVLGLGIDRGKIGDIFIFEDCTYVFSLSDISEYLALNLERVGKTAVKTETVDVCDVQMPEKNVVEKRVTVSSLRLDAVVGAVFNMSRGKSAALIESEKVFVNWNEEVSVSKLVKEGDMLSVRGFGRSKIIEAGSRTKKDKVVVLFEKYV